MVQNLKNTKLIISQKGDKCIIFIVANAHLPLLLEPCPNSYMQNRELKIDW